MKLINTYLYQGDTNRIRIPVGDAVYHCNTFTSVFASIIYWHVSDNSAFISTKYMYPKTMREDNK